MAALSAHNQVKLATGGVGNLGAGAERGAEVDMTAVFAIDACRTPVGKIKGSLASARTQQVMIAWCRSRSPFRPVTQAASAGCRSPASEQTQRAESCSTSTPTAWPAMAMTTKSPECASENDGTGRAPVGPGPGSTTGLPDGLPHWGQRSRSRRSRPGAVPV